LRATRGAKFVRNAWLHQVSTKTKKIVLGTAHVKNIGLSTTPLGDLEQVDFIGLHRAFSNWHHQHAFNSSSGADAMNAWHGSCIFCSITGWPERLEEFTSKFAGFCRGTLLFRGKPQSAHLESPQHCGLFLSLLSLEEAAFQRWGCDEVNLHPRMNSMTIRRK
jgi:hypothetical protein